MYKKNNGWFKHYDFILLDMLCLQIAFIVAFWLFVKQGVNPYSNLLYRNMAIFIEFADIAVLFLISTLKNVLKRGYYREFLMTLENSLSLAGVSTVYLFLIQRGHEYSRLALVFTFILYHFLTYTVRVLWKKHLRNTLKDGDTSLLLVVTSENASKVVQDVQANNLAKYKLAGLAIIDKEMTGETVYGVEVVADANTAVEYVVKSWVDEVLIVTPGDTPYPSKLIDDLTETGVTVHLSLAKIQSIPGKRQFVEKVNSYTVLTTTMNYCSYKQLFVKRAMDIVAGLIGCVFTGIFFIFVAPAIYIASPGPVFFAQERVGRNGKTFKMYKFRSMYLDADERKAELMSQNKISDPRMFKMDFDPRIIGNKILPDGTHKTGIGNFIRKTSIDEFPQFFNVLKGDMSLVGTRPPLLSETSLYEPHHRQRLAIKPGITGMWQVSGRSDITDFEEVVRLDKDYINNWNIGLDIKILLKTFLVVLGKEGSM